jgi:two-component system nitrogen regulation sensor histidine kinase NtrY
VALVVLEQKVLSLSRVLPIESDAVFLALVHLNVIGIGVLVFLCARNVVKLVIERRRGILGSKLNTKFVVAFVFMAAVSTTALFLFSAFLVNRAIGTWFQLEVTDSLEQALDVANAHYRAKEDDTLAFARLIARRIEEQRLLREDALDDLQRFVAEKQLEYSLGVVEVFSAQLEQLASATHPDVAVIVLEAPESELIRTGLSGVEGTRTGPAGPGDLVRSVVPIRSSFHEPDVVGVVAVNSFIPRGLGQKAEKIRSALQAYRRLEPSEGAFQTSMVLLLALITLSIVLFSSWMGFRLAKQITVPIQQLAGAAAEIASGNLDVRIEHAARDEIGLLVQAFNRMATDVATTREDIERRRAQMEIVLRSVAAGVISLDRDGAISVVNPSALRLLGLERGVVIGRKVSEVVGGRALETLEDLLRRLASGPREMLRRQVPFVIGERLRTLDLTVSRLRDVEGGAAGFVIVVDDVTEILEVQRMAAWRDVARRIAHEIKNPLTPIQLSAQRLRRKLAGRLPDGEAEGLLRQCTEAITGQVEALKLLVAEFSNFARLPATDPAPSDLNALVAEVVAMYREHRSVRFTSLLASDLPTLDLDREQIKRVVLNLLDNAIGAVEAVEEGPREIRVRTRVDRAVGTVTLEIADTGVGIPTGDRARLFEPYFSTKREGSGLGLAIVSRIVSDHSGTIRLRDNTPRGTRFLIELPLRT